jgi:hypothetical protein
MTIPPDISPEPSAAGATSFTSRFGGRGATLEISPAQRAGCWLQNRIRPEGTAEIQRPFGTHEFVWRAASHFVAGLFPLALRAPLPFYPLLTSKNHNRWLANLTI